MRRMVKWLLLLSFTVMYIRSTAQNSVWIDLKFDTVLPDNKWKFLGEAYMLFGNMKGTMGIDSLPAADVDASAGDLLDHFKFGISIYFEAYKNKWAICTDISYIKLGAEIRRDPHINSGEAVSRQLMFEASGLRKLLSFLELGVGLRLNSLKIEMDLNYNTSGGVKSAGRSLSETWVDPFVAARAKFNLLNDLLFLHVRGDIGGFGVGSDLAWGAQGYAGIRISRTFQASIGYRIISTDYENGSRKDYFLYDVDVFGPVVRLGINF